MQAGQLQSILESYYKKCERKHSKETLTGKKQEYNTLVAFLNNKPYTLENIQRYVDIRYDSLSAQNSRYDLITKLRTLTKWLFDNGYILEDFSKQLDKPSISKRVNFDYYDPVVVDQVIESGTTPDAFVFGKTGDNARNVIIKEETRLALKFILRTGLRISELISLTGNSLNISDESFWVVSKGAKNGERDLLPIPRDMIEELKKRQENKKLFKVTEKTCNAALKRGMKKLNLSGEMTNHSLRHICATAMTKQGIPIQTISRLLRHKDIRTTNDYYMHLNVNDLGKAVNGMPIVQEGTEVNDIIADIEQYAREKANDSRFKGHVVQKLEDCFILKIPYSSS